MVTIVNKFNRNLHTEALNEMFRFRHQVAVGEMGWKLPDATHGYDIDNFDTMDTIYFLDYSESGKLIGSARLNPTVLPHLLSDVFPEFCEFDDVPRGEKIYEFSRYLISKNGTSHAEFILSRARILLAVNEYALANGIETLTLLTYKKHYALAAYLFETKPLGLPQFYPSDNEDYIAMTCAVSQEGIDKTSKYTNIPTPVGRLDIPLHLASVLNGADQDQEQSNET